METFRVKGLLRSQSYLPGNPNEHPMDSKVNGMLLSDFDRFQPTMITMPLTPWARLSSPHFLQ